MSMLMIGVLILGGYSASATLYAAPKDQVQPKSNDQITPSVLGDEVDQTQTLYSTWMLLGYDGSNWMFAQSFIPQKPMLTRVKLYLARFATPNPFILAIRSDVAGENLTVITVNANHIPSDNPGWVEFDFNDLSVTVGDTYYIIAATTIQPNTYYRLGIGENNPYPNGTAYEAYDWIYWTPAANIDLCFMTYGKESPLQIGSISGGVGKVCATITNQNGADVTNLDWNISVTGGILRKIHAENNGTIALLHDGSSELICTNTFILGIGVLDITISATMQTGEKVIVNVNGVVFFFLITIK